MKIKFGALEGYRQNPKSFWNKGVGFPRKSSFSRWQDAISYYHKKDEDLKKAEEYLKLTLSKVKTLKDSQLIEYLGNLQEYHNDYSKLDSSIFEFRETMNFPLKFDYTLSGWIPRLDINLERDGYSAYFFEKTEYDWYNELRFPVLQHFLSDNFDCKVEDIFVGVYFLDKGIHLKKSFSGKEVISAKEELDYLVEQIEQNRK